MNTKPPQQPSSRIRWQGQIESVQCRAWVWRYKTDNPTHHHLGFNLFVKGEADGREGRFIVAVSDTQHTKLQFRIGDVFKGTAWSCIKAKHAIADYHRAGGFKVLSRADEQGVNEPLHVVEMRKLLAGLEVAYLWAPTAPRFTWVLKRPGRPASMKTANGRRFFECFRCP